MEMVKFKQAVIDTYGEEKLEQISGDPLSENKLSLVVDFSFSENADEMTTGVDVDVTMCGQISLEQEMIAVCELLKILQVPPMILSMAVNLYFSEREEEDNE